MLASDVVRWVSIVLALLFLLAARPRSGLLRRSQPPARASRPLDAASGPLWVGLHVLCLIAFLIEAAVPDWVYDGPLTVQWIAASALQLVGLAVGSLGGGIHWWAGRELGKHNVLQIEVGKDHRLVTSGPYRRIRHPIYGAVLLMNTGAALFLLNAVLLVLVPLTYVVARRRAVLEEEVLASPEGFGAEYREYARQTGRFLPRLRIRR